MELASTAGLGPRAHAAATQLVDFRPIVWRRLEVLLQYSCGRKAHIEIVQIVLQEKTKNAEVLMSCYIYSTVRSINAPLTHYAKRRYTYLLFKKEKEERHWLEMLLLVF